MPGLNLCVHGEEFHFGVDGFHNGRPRLYRFSTCMVPEVHDGVAEMYAIALVITVFQECIELTAKRGRGHIDMNTGHACNVEIVFQGGRFPYGPRRCIGENRCGSTMLVMSVPNSKRTSVESDGG